MTFQFLRSRPMVARVAATALLLWLVCRAAAIADEPLQYNRDIRPILAEHCFACHGLDSGSREADLRLDLRDAAIQTGAIVPKNPAASELVARIMSDDEDAIMPPPESDPAMVSAMGGFTGCLRVGRQQ